MKHLLKTLPLVALLAVAAPTVMAQTAETTPEADEESSADALELSMGEEESTDPSIGDIYVDSEHGDWEIRCFVSDQEQDPCQLYQLLDDGNGNPVAEINIFPLPGGEGPAAGATVITPLETLLTQQLALSIDGGAAKKYPYSWCGTVGCFSRLGFSDGDVNAFKRGAAATLTIVPVADPNAKVNLTVSLSGFTSAFDTAKAKMASQ